MKYRLIGYDQFSNEEYSLSGIYDSLEDAQKAVEERRATLLATQYASPGFHDRTYITDIHGKVIE